MKALIESKNSKLDRLEELVVVAKSEKRAFTTKECEEVETLKSEIRAIEKEIEDITSKREKRFKEEENKMEFRTMKDAVLPGERLEKRTYEDNKNYDLGKLVRAMAGKDTKSDEAVYYRAMQTGGNEVVIPLALADRIVDYARNYSAVLGKIPTIQMDSNNLRVAKQVSDVEAHWVAEGELIPESAATFEAIDLEGKTLALWVPINEQLLDSAANLSEQLVQSCSKAIAIALDKALLYGDGDELLQAHKIKGLMTYNNINKVEHQVVGEGINYDPLLKAIAPIKKANLQATDVALSTDVGLALAGYKTGDGMYIDGPKVLNNYAITESNNMQDQHILAYDRNQLLLGINKNITVAWGTSGDQFQRIQKGLRIHLRADLGVINEKAISQVTLRR